MKINISKELKTPGLAVAHHLESAMDGFGYLGREMVFASPITLDVECLYDGSAIAVKGKLATAFNTECARCGKKLTDPIFVGLEERFVCDADDNSEYFHFKGEELDLSRMILSSILLNVNCYHLCGEDCKGLCPVCGCDLNISQCSCDVGLVKEKPNNQLAMLHTLLNDDKEV